MTTLKSLATIWVAIANNLYVHPKSLSTFERRIESEGITFLTITLPGLGKDLERALSTGRLELTTPFKKKRGTALPLFLNELFAKAFYSDGYVMSPPEGLRELRQLTMLCYKFEMPFTPKQELEAIQKFRATDASVKTSDWPEDLPLVKKTMESLFPDNPFDIRPHHSSGQTADKVSNVDKRIVRRFIPHLCGTFDLSYFFSDVNHGKTWLKNNTLETTTPKSRVTIVPKDSRGGRTICMEPHEQMFIQKGLMQKIYDHIENDSPAKGRLNFTDQSINRRLAQNASIGRRYATIDLKDASDLVSWELIKKVVPREWLIALNATRSPVATIEGQDDITFKKFAPMGSALCFPIEAMLFYSIARLASPIVWVYGDDIIVPTHRAEKVMRRLEEFGLKVNRDKTLIDGFFRESCGGDFYHGEPIDYIKLRSLDLASYVDFCNLFADRYGDQMASNLVSLYENHRGTQILRQPRALRSNAKPLVFYTDYFSSASVFFRRRWNNALQKWELRSLTVRAKTLKHSSLTDDDAYFDWLTNSMSSSSPEEFYTLRQIEREYSDNPRKVPKRIVRVDPKGPLQGSTPETKFEWGTHVLAH